MAELIIHQEKITDNQELVKICPFGAMEEKDGKLSINAACKMCRLCVKTGAGNRSSGICSIHGKSYK